MTNCKKNRRSGTATVEFALCAPVFFLIVFAGIEIARVNMLIQTVDSACVQAARRGIVPGATASDVTAVASQTLNLAMVTGFTVVVTPTVITDQTEDVTVTVSVPIDVNGYVMPRFFGGKTIASTLTFTRE